MRAVTQAEYTASRWRVATVVLESSDDSNIHWTAFEEAVSVLFCALPDGTPTPGWMPDRGTRPERSEAWQALIDLLIQKKWGTRVVAAARTAAEADEYEHVRDLEMQERAQLAARIALTDGILDKAMNMTGRLRRDFIRLLEQYSALKAA